MSGLPGLSRRAALATGLAATGVLLAERSFGAQPHTLRKTLAMISPPAAVPAAETFDGTWPFEARYSRAAGFAMHYVEQGEGPETLLLLHGEPTWGYLFRKQIAAWATRHRVIAVDHMGFGKSEAPQDRQYRLQDHIDNLERFVLERDLTGITLVMHDFGGPTGMGLAARHPDRIKRIVSVNGPTPLGQGNLGELLTANGAVSPWFQWIAKAHKAGTLEQVLGQLDYTILSTLKLNGFGDNSLITDTWLAAYRAPFPTPAHARGAIGWAKGFAEGAHVFEPADARVKALLAAKPALAIWGMADRTLQPQFFLPLFRAAFPSGRVEELAEVGHYSPEDAPDAVTRLVNTFIGFWLASALVV